MSKTCSECTYLNIEHDHVYGKYYCDKLGERHYATDEACYRYCPAYTRSSNDSKNAFDISKNSQSNSGCFITTTLCGILQMDDKNIFLETLRGFRKNYLQKNKEGIEILVKYDEVGPIISDNLANASGKINMSLILFENYIKPITNMINQKEYSKAISSYTEMTNKLIKFFNIDDTVKTNIDEVEPSLSGHGRIVKKLV